MSRKTSKTESALGWFVLLSGIIGLIGATMLTWNIQYGEEIALTGAIWFTASFVTALLYTASRVESEKEKKEIKRLKEQTKELKKHE